MSILHNPNVQRTFAAFGLAVALGVAACSSGETPTPNPTVTETEAPAYVPEIPSCAVHAKVAGHVAHLTIQTNAYDDPNWSPDNFDYMFGDGSPGAKDKGARLDHTYPEAGDYKVDADMHVDVADTAAYPYRSTTIGCDPVSFTIK